MKLEAELNKEFGEHLEQLSETCVDITSLLFKKLRNAKNPWVAECNERKFILGIHISTFPQQLFVPFLMA
jgi:hypothetical protein